jgi:hypothetical protein
MRGHNLYFIRIPLETVMVTCESVGGVTRDYSLVKVGVTGMGETDQSSYRGRFATIYNAWTRREDAPHIVSPNVENPNDEVFAQVARAEARRPFYQDIGYLFPNCSKTEVELREFFFNGQTLDKLAINNDGTGQELWPLDSGT